MKIFSLISLVLIFTAGISYSAEKALTSTTNILLPNGLIIQKNTTYYLYPNKSYSRFIAAEDYVLPTTMIVKAGTEVSYYEDKKLKSFILSKNWVEGTNGDIFESNTMVSIYPNGNLISFTCLNNWLDPDTGMTIKGHSTLYFYDNGKTKKLTLAKSFNYKKELTFLENTDVIWDSTGNIRVFTLGKNFKAFKKGQQLFIQKDGNYKIFDPSKDQIE